MPFVSKRAGVVKMNQQAFDEGYEDYLRAKHWDSGNTGYQFWYDLGQATASEDVHGL